MITEPMAAAFARLFADWGITLPADAPPPGEVGVIHAARWTIHYRLDGDHLDFYATNRMTSDRHVRITAAGEVIHLDAPREFMVFPKGATDEDRARIEAEYFAENRRIYAELERKGFL